MSKINSFKCLMNKKGRQIASPKNFQRDIRNYYLIPALFTGNLAVGLLKDNARGLAIEADLAFGFIFDFAAGFFVAGLALDFAAALFFVLFVPLFCFSFAIDSLRYVFAVFSKRT